MFSKVRDFELLKGLNFPQSIFEFLNLNINSVLVYFGIFCMLCIFSITVLLMFLAVFRAIISNSNQHWDRQSMLSQTGGRQKLPRQWLRRRWWPRLSALASMTGRRLHSATSGQKGAQAQSVRSLYASNTTRSSVVYHDAAGTSGSWSLVKHWPHL